MNKYFDNFLELNNELNNELKNKISKLYNVNIEELSEEEYKKYLDMYDNSEKEKEKEEEKRKEIEKQKKKEEQTKLKHEINKKTFLETVPTRYRTADIRYYKNNQEDLNIMSSLTSGYNAIIHSAENGTGKTYLCYAFAIFEAGRGKNCCVIKALRMLDEFKKFENGRFDKFYDCDILIIDECDKILGSKYDSTKFFDVIDYRYEWEKQTILVANAADGGHITDIVGPAIISRFIETGKIINYCQKQWRNNL